MIALAAVHWVPPFAQGLVRDLRVRWTALDASGEEQATCDAAADAMREGRTGTLDRLAAHLARPMTLEGADHSLPRRRGAPYHAKEDMMAKLANRITPCLWFDGQAGEAAEFYVSIFDDARIGKITRFTPKGRELHGQEPGAVMAVEFELDGHSFLGINGGPQFKFSEAVSFQVHCATQDEIDHFWNRLSDGGEEGRCGWLKDRFGLSWQVVPEALPKLMSDPDPEKVRRVVAAFMQMRKFDIAAMERAYHGDG